MTVEEQERGRQIARQAITAAQTIFGDRLSSAYLIGSLAHGGFVAEVSDVDVALVLDPTRSGDDHRVSEISRRVLARDDSPLARRLSVFWTDQQSLRDGQPTGRLPAIDWLDLVEAGVLAHGEPLPGDVPRPSSAQLVQESASFAVRQWRDDPAWHQQLGDGASLVRQGRRAASKAALFPVRFLYTLATGRAGGSHDAADWYVASHQGPAKMLVQSAHRWRTHGFDDTAAAARLLNLELISLYREFEITYRPRLIAQHQQALADQLSTMIARLDLRTDDEQTGPGEH